MRQKSKLTKADFLRSWGLQSPPFRYHHLRYTSPPEKGVYWHYFSLEVRMRDVGLWGTCISCGRPITMETCDAGHFAPAANCGLDLLFDPVNVNAECAHCNAFDEMHLIGYAKNLDKRYGYGTAEMLYAKRQNYKDQTPYQDGTMPRAKDWKPQEYADKIKTLTSYLKAQSSHNGATL